MTISSSLLCKVKRPSEKAGQKLVQFGGCGKHEYYRLEVEKVEICRYIDGKPMPIRSKVNEMLEIFEKRVNVLACYRGGNQTNEILEFPGPITGKSHEHLPINTYMRLKLIFRANMEGKWGRRKM